MNKTLRNGLEILLASTLMLNSCSNKEVVKADNTNSNNSINEEENINFNPETASITFYFSNKEHIIFFETNKEIMVQRFYLDEKDSTTSFIFRYFDYDKDDVLDEYKVIKRKLNHGIINESEKSFNIDKDRDIIMSLQNEFLSYILYFKYGAGNKTKN